MDRTRELLAERKVPLFGLLDDKLATLVIAQLLYLQDRDPDVPIEVLIDSPGGPVTSALAIAHTFADIRPRVDTICVGSAEGTAALILASGARGHRRAHSSARIEIGELSGGETAPPAQLERLARVWSGLLYAATGRTVIELCAAGESFDVEGARALGLIDTVVTQ